QADEIDRADGLAGGEVVDLGGERGADEDGVAGAERVVVDATGDALGRDELGAAHLVERAVGAGGGAGELDPEEPAADPGDGVADAVVVVPRHAPAGEALAGAGVVDLDLAAVVR